jgi:tRNA modification GTPase
MPPARDTIFALSSGRLPAAIAIVRISGPRAGDALKALAGKIPEPRKAAFARIRHPDRGAENEIIDEALALWFPGPNSETGEDTAELQLHGGRAVVAAVLGALARIEGLRPAEAGEFTRRAFENGKLDLTAVEGLADLVMAETQAQRRQAFRQMKGLLGNRAEDWRALLIKALALVEARIDFSEEADVPKDLLKPALAITRELAKEIEAALADAGRGERLRDGLVVAIAGPPNTGKSTLLNRIARREAAIVSALPGTTRDVIEVHLDLGGCPVTLLDTAGIRDTDDPVELEGVRRARSRAADADLVLWLSDAREPASPLSAHSPGVVGRRALSKLQPNQYCAIVPSADSVPSNAGTPANPAPASTPSLAASELQLPPSHQAIWAIRNKVDLAVQRNESKILSNASSEPVSLNNKCMETKKLTSRNEYESNKNELEFSISALTGAGLEDLFAALTRYAKDFVGDIEPALITRERHRHVLADTLAALRRALSEDVAAREDLLAEDLRVAAQALGRLTGRVDVEDVLDVIFRDFCIGK